MSRKNLNTILCWLVPIVLGIQINHIIANRSDIKPLFGIAIYPDNRGLTVFFGALLSTILIFVLLYLSRWRAASVLDRGWPDKVFRPNKMILYKTTSLGKAALRVLLIAGVILPMVNHLFLVHRWFKDTDVYIRICAQNTDKKNPFRDSAIVSLYPEIENAAHLTCRQKLTGAIESNDTRRCIQSNAGPYCRISTDWTGHFVLVGSESFWSILFGRGRDSFRLGYDDRLVTYFPRLLPGLGLGSCLLLLLYWLDTLAMIFVSRVRFWWTRPQIRNKSLLLQ